MQPTLVILAAGMASRYGSMKQTEAFGPGGETIMEYSIFDAIRSGFSKVVFIIREEFADAFKAQFEPRLNGKIEIDYVYQRIHDFVGSHTVPSDRVKPWGTAHALLCCKGKITEPFAIINADDFYGREAFEKAAKFLQQECNETTYAIMGYELSKTLSGNGSVSRGVCSVNEAQQLVNIRERTKIYRDHTSGKIIFEEENGNGTLPDNTLVSMNFFGFHPNIIALAEKLFGEFLDKHIKNIKSEFFIPLVVDEFVKRNLGVVKVLPTSAQWFGVTYKEDAPEVKKSIEALVQTGVYPEYLWK
ncbi:MAG: nucleotidyltransferase [Hydrotalea flava]|uniref:nucleotidyltransferase family protein n=1 Tax=Hydrotalea lipotrueae TaxID=2803817 RepID=UPI001C468633|nr:sugar phosphate nucleotidyltransferase [Hydrotalea lipotrueae]MBY0349236.1 nucleotidyltransferase [Hydrotalea flava]